MKMEIVLVEDYAHPLARVWAALTDPRALAEWLMTNDFEPRIGKRFTFSGPPSADWRGWMDCEVLEIEAPRRMVWSWRRSEAEPPNRVEFRLEPIAGGTRLTLLHTGDTEPAIEGRYRSGWPAKLATLRQILVKLD